MEAVFARLESSLETIAETSKCANQLTIDFTSRPLLTLLVERCNVCETLNRHGRNIVHEFLPRSQDPRKSQDSGKKKGLRCHIDGIAAEKEGCHGAQSPLDGSQLLAPTE